MKATMLVIHATDPTVLIRQLNAPLELEVVQQFVGGHFEVVPFFTSIHYAGEEHPCVAFVNDDGKQQKLPYNAAATKIWTQAMHKAGLAPPTDILSGDVVAVFGDAEFMGTL